MFKIRLCLPILLIVFASHAHAQFINGDFQSNFGYGCNAGNNWSFDSNPTNYCEITDIFQPGNWWIDLTPCGDFGNGTWVEQDVTTVAGACYTVTMDIASYCGWDGSDSGIYLEVDGVQIGERIFNDVFSCIPGTLGWGTFTSDVFTATSNTTTIRFIGEGRCSAISDPLQCSPLGGIGNPGVIGLDNIILNQVSDSPLAINALPDVNLCDNETATIGQAIDNASYLWSTGETTALIDVDEPGEYRVTISTECAVVMDTVVVQVAESPLPFDLGEDQQFCGDFELTLDAGTSVNWSTGAVASSIVISSGGVYSASLTNFCGSVSDEIAIEQIEEPLESFELDVLLCEGETVVLTAPSEDAQWSTGALGSAIVVNTGGDYSAAVSNLCGDGLYQYHVTTDPCGYIFYAPNSFTPDNDGLNDTWHPVLEGEVDNISIAIFNRWGEEIWNTNRTDIHWTGQVRSGNYYAPDGIYIYRAEIALNSVVTEYTGHIVMMR
ncbi:MAG: gliding motility-associated C-terminal domain-containing protein [Flavobacteriales bacterium]